MESIFGNCLALYHFVGFITLTLDSLFTVYILLVVDVLLQKKFIADIYHHNKERKKTTFQGLEIDCNLRQTPQYSLNTVKNISTLRASNLKIILMIL